MEEAVEQFNLKMSKMAT